MNRLNNRYPSRLPYLSDYCNPNVVAGPLSASLDPHQGAGSCGRRQGMIDLWSLIFDPFPILPSPHDYSSFPHHIWLPTAEICYRLFITCTFSICLTDERVCKMERVLPPLSPSFLCLLSYSIMYYLYETRVLTKIKLICERKLKHNMNDRDAEFYCNRTMSDLQHQL